MAFIIINAIFSVIIKEIICEIISTKWAQQSIFLQLQLSNSASELMAGQMQKLANLLMDSIKINNIYEILLSFAIDVMTNKNQITIMTLCFLKKLC